MLYKDIGLDYCQEASLHRQVWRAKPSLSYFYSEAFFKKIKYYCSRFPVLEVGSGPGFLKDYWREIIISDVFYMPWLDIVSRCEKLPFKDSTFANLVCVDVFHHLASPVKFLKEAERVLVPKGQIIMIEPWITSFSYIFWKYVHHEMCKRVQYPWTNTSKEDMKPFDGNAYIPYQCFGRKNQRELKIRCPHLKLKRIELLGVFVYPLTGGFQPALGIRSASLIKALLHIERLLEPALSPFSATRALIVLENLKQDSGNIKSKV